MIDGDEVSILWMVPITNAELKYKLENGGAALEELFAERKLSHVIDESRKSLV